MVTLLCKVNPKKNCRRFYRVAVESTLFDEICLTRTWGRLGGKARQLEPMPFVDPVAAEKAASKIIRSKLKRGYVVKELE
jgi:predicted DNA-binding WGR domain protein